MRYYLAYFWYILKHKWFVFWAGLKLKVPIGQLISHDMSKFSKMEFVSYMENFTIPKLTGHPPSKAVKKRFANAWNHHLWCGLNKHHWEVWDDNIMPDEFLLEMIADWIGAGRAKGFPDTLAWYTKQRDKIRLHPETKAMVDSILEWSPDGS